MPERFLEHCAQRGFEPPAYPTRVVSAPLDGVEDRPLLQAAFEFLHRELPWRRTGHARATAACIDLILVALSRRMAQPTGADGAPPARRLSHNFKQLVNAHAAEGWSVRETERRVKGEGGEAPKRKPRERHPDEEAAIGRAEDAFERALGHDVRVSTGSKGLTVRITFEDLDELLAVAGSIKRG